MDAISELDLDLRGMRVATELGTGSFLASALLVTLAGGEAIAVGRDGPYGSFEEASNALDLIQEEIPAPSKVLVTSDRGDPRLAGVDVVLNLGNLRPIDLALLDRVGKDAVVSYMCEAWEERPGDVDFGACETSGIPVYFTDENGWGLGLFNQCGLLALKLILEAGADVTSMNVAIVSSDAYGDVAKKAIEAHSGRTCLVNPSAYDGLLEHTWDVLLVADYASTQTLLGGAIPMDALREILKPGALIAQLCGQNDTDTLRREGYEVFPEWALPPKRMSFTLASLGDRPVARLHAAGLKVGWAACEGRRRGLDGGELDRFVLERSPAQLRMEHDT